MGIKQALELLISHKVDLYFHFRSAMLKFSFELKESNLISARTLDLALRIVLRNNLFNLLTVDKFWKYQDTDNFMRCFDVQ